MGADTTSTHLIFFIAATVVAVAASGVLTTVILDLSNKAALKGETFGDQLASDVTIINDPANVAVSPDAIFYLKNTGSTTLATETLTLFMDGSHVAGPTVTLLGSEATFRPGAVAQISYTPSPAIAAGDHTVRIVMGNGISDDLKFRVS